MSCATPRSSPASTGCSSKSSTMPELPAGYDPADPDPWMALAMDRSLPFDAAAKADLIRDQASRSRRYLLPVVRPFARTLIALAWLIHVVSPHWPHAPRLLHRLIAFGMRRFL